MEGYLKQIKLVLKIGECLQYQSYCQWSTRKEGAEGRRRRPLMLNIR